MAIVCLKSDISNFLSYCFLAECHIIFIYKLIYSFFMLLICYQGKLILDRSS